MKSLILVLSIIAAVAASPAARIVGGEETTIDKVPYLVSVRYHDQHHCGGTILDANTLLTAAHCVVNLSVNKLSVRAGATEHWEGVPYKLASVVIHPSFRVGQHDYDVAVLKTQTVIQFDVNTQPLELVMPGGEAAAGTTCYIAGWGTISENSQIISQVVRSVDVELITYEMCRSQYGSEINPNMECCQTLGHDNCQGDSGGALVCNGVVQGVATFARGCARPAFAGVYMRIAPVFAWIDNQIS